MGAKACYYFNPLTPFFPMLSNSEPPIRFTPAAFAQLKEAFEEKNVPEGYHLRVGVKGGGCAGFSYVLGFDEPGDQDRRYDIEGLPLCIAKKDLMHLLEMTIDYEASNEAVGFVFLEPEEAPAPNQNS